MITTDRSMVISDNFDHSESLVVTTDRLMVISDNFDHSESLVVQMEKKIGWLY